MNVETYPLVSDTGPYERPALVPLDDRPAPQPFVAPDEPPGWKARGRRGNHEIEAWMWPNPFWTPPPPMKWLNDIGVYPNMREYNEHTTSFWLVRPDLERLIAVDSAPRYPFNLPAKARSRADHAPSLECSTVSFKLQEAHDDRMQCARFFLNYLPGELRVVPVTECWPYSDRECLISRRPMLNGTLVVQHSSSHGDSYHGMGSVKSLWNLLKGVDRFLCFACGEDMGKFRQPGVKGIDLIQIAGGPTENLNQVALELVHESPLVKLTYAEICHITTEEYNEMLILRHISILTKVAQEYGARCVHVLDEHMRVWKHMQLREPKGYLAETKEESSELPMIEEFWSCRQEAAKRWQRGPFRMGLDPFDHLRWGHVPW